MVTSEATELLQKATDLLMDDGWCRGAFHNEAGERCSLGAMIQAKRLLDMPPFTDAYVEACNRLGAAAGVSPTDIMGWNDKPERTAEDVILAFKKAACE